MGIAKLWCALRGLQAERFSSTDSFSPSEAMSEFESSEQVRNPDLQAARQLERRMGRPYKRLVPVLLCSLYLLCIVVFFALGAIELSTVVVVCGLMAAFAAVFAVFVRVNRHAMLRDRQMRLPTVVAAAITLLVAFYLEPITQIVLTPFLFVAMAYGLFTLSRRAALVVCLGNLAGYGVIVGLHHLVLDNPALLRLEVMHFVALALALPAFVLLMGRVRLLHRLLQKTSHQMQSIAEIARHDALAGCLNRRSILAALEEQKQLADESGISLCLAVIDLDHFKRINDEMGHLGGDEVLRTFAQITQQTARTDDFFGRYGGEEFLLVFPATPLLPALNSCERIRSHIESYPWDGPLRGRVTVSIGVTQYVLGESVLEFFSRADTAMYLAKQGGRNQVVVQEPAVAGAPADDGALAPPAHGYF